MRITINSFGTRGDVQPYLALGHGLEQSGHQVRVLSHEIHRELVEQEGFEFFSIPVDPKQVMLDHVFSEMGNNVFQIMKFLRDHSGVFIDELFKITDEAAEGADLLINSSLSIAGYHVAEKRKIPALAAYLQPVTPTRHFHGMSIPPPPSWFPLKGIYNYASIKLSNQLFFGLMLPLTNQTRERVLGLPPLKARYYWNLDTDPGFPLVYGYSSLVLPKPSDWGKNLHVTGYWILQQGSDFEPDDALQNFLASGHKPVYIGFGSMIDHEKEEITRLILEALEISGTRAVLLGGWSGLGGRDLPGTVMAIDYAPHEWLFPRMVAVIHHGGAGTTAAGLRAGIPSVIVPFFADQFFWGWRVEKLGVGPDAIRREDLTAARLAAGIEAAIENQSMRRNAAELGQRLRSENGVANAVKAIEMIMRDPPYVNVS
jgi:sterol 3beta-glucosyltransferase